LLTYRPRVELCEADSRVDVYLRQAVGKDTGYVFVAYGIVYVTMSHQCNQLLGAIFLYLFDVDRITYFIPQIPDAEYGRRAFHNVQCLFRQVQLALDEP